MGIEQNSVICVADILGSVKEMTMRVDVMEAQISLQNLPGIMDLKCLFSWHFACPLGRFESFFVC